ncbi:MAG: hypothetical protein IKA13_00525 [Bacteroidales bacterium]|nr:hypothetical protein [Bacteroidales bacterium]
MKGIARRQQDAEDFAFSLTSFFSFLKVFLFFIQNLTIVSWTGTPELEDGRLADCK